MRSSTLLFTAREKTAAEEPLPDVLLGVIQELLELACHETPEAVVTFTEKVGVVLSTVIDVGNTVALYPN